MQWFAFGPDHVANSGKGQIIGPMTQEALGGPYQPNVLSVLCLCPQRSARSWWSSSNAWSSSRSLGCSCYRTSRSFSAGKLRSSLSTPAAWRSWLSGSPPRSAAPGSTSLSEKGPGSERGRGGLRGEGAGRQSWGGWAVGHKAERRQGLIGGGWLPLRPWVCRTLHPQASIFLDGK